MKIPRFVKEYSGYKLKELETLKKRFPGDTAIYDEYIDIINKSVRAFSCGLITLDECMECIAKH